MSLRLRRLVCRWYGHDWALGTPCDRACLYDVCFRCGQRRLLHALQRRYCTHRLERTPA